MRRNDSRLRASNSESAFRHGSASRELNSIIGGVNRSTMSAMNNVASPATAKVLIVDDEEAQRTGLASMVSSWGYTADTAPDGQVALEKLNSGSYQVLVTDLMMPKMDGFELLKRLTGQGNMPPAIVLTAFGNIHTSIATIHDLGAYWVLEKPIPPAAFRILLDRAT